MEFPPPPPPPTDRKPFGWLKIVAIGCGAALGLVFLLGVGSALWIGSYSKKMVASAGQYEREGIAAARGTDEAGCVALGQGRAKGKGGVSVSAAISTTYFMRSCLRSARVTPGFCDGVPAASSIASSSAWTQARCQAHAADAASNIACNAVSQSVQRFCTMDHEKVPPDSALALLDAAGGKVPPDGRR